MSLWDEPHRGRHHYAMALSKKHQVLWVNRSLNWRERKEVKIGIEKISDNLHVLHTGRNIIPGRIEKRINLDNHRRLRLLCKELVHYGKPDIVWIYDYKALQFASYFKNKAITLYFCNDFFGEFAYKRYESKLAMQVDYVFATDPKLVARLKPYNENCYFMPHGVWPTIIHPKFIKKKIPETVGYVGTLRSVIDTDILRQIVENSQIKLILAGPFVESDKNKETEFKTLIRHPQVTYLGNLNLKDAQKAINEMDICLLPYTVHMRGFAIKYFDYLAAGKPIIATKYSFVWPKPFREFVHIYDNNQDIRSFIEEVFSKWDKEKFEKALALTANSSWEHRVQQIGKIIKQDL